MAYLCAIMVKEVTGKTIEELFRTPIIQQTAYWSKVKSHFGMESMAFNFVLYKEEGIVLRDLVVFIKNVDKD